MGTYSWRSASLASVGMLLFMVSACKMGPDYVRPETPKADSWRVPTSTAESIANLAWWELLKDKDLQELIRIALTENQDVRTAVASVEQYRAQLVMTRWDLAPALAYGGTAFLYHTSGGDATTIPGGGGAIVLPGQAGRDSNTFSNTIGFGSLKWEIDLWGPVVRAGRKSTGGDPELAGKRQRSLLFSEVA